MKSMDKVEEVARALCRATGKNPDEMQIDRPKDIPQWQLYELEARKLVAAFEVMSKKRFSQGNIDDDPSSEISLHNALPD
jgi:hypothetical protein